MIRRQTFALTAVLILATGCRYSADVSTAQLNKALVRQMIQEMDSSPGADLTAKWMTEDYQLHLNGAPPMDLAAYRGLVKEVTTSFSNVKHDIHHMVAEGDTVAVGITLRMTHSGTYEGIAATGRAIAIEEFVVLRIRDGKVTSEWLVIDLGGLHQQLTAPTK